MGIGASRAAGHEGVHGQAEHRGLRERGRDRGGDGDLERSFRSRRPAP